MKAYIALTMLFVCSLINLHSSFAQTEIEKYKQTDLIEGSNLYVSGSPAFFSNVMNDSTKSSNAYINLSATFVKWRFTRWLDYSADIRSTGRLSRSKYVERGIEDSYNSTDAHIDIRSGADYYPVKDKLYGGFYINSTASFGNRTKPYSSSDVYAFVGLGRLVNAAQVIHAKNIENALKDEGFIKSPFRSKVLSMLTILLDKRRNSEFVSKYKDDADIEFYSQVENLLFNEKVISSPLNSRATLKLFQVLTNSSFIYYPRYKGYMVQTELGFSNSNNSYAPYNGNSLKLIISGVYGVPIGLRTDLVFSCYAGFPLNDKRAGLLNYPVFHSPLFLRDASDPYIPSRVSPLPGEEFDYIGGAKALVFYNISSTAGVTGFADFSYGKTQNAKNNFELLTMVNFSYNILSRMVLNASLELRRDQIPSTWFSSGLQFNYIVF